MNRPHTTHGDLSPAEFAAEWTTINQPKPHNGWTNYRIPLRPTLV